MKRFLVLFFGVAACASAAPPAPKPSPSAPLPKSPHPVEQLDLAKAEACHGLALSLGPKSPECLYSVFLAKLYWVQRVLNEQGVGLVLCEVEPAVHAIFEACKLDEQFRFAADFDAAVEALKS